MQREVYASSATCEWETPQDFFDQLNAQYHFDLDVCATPENAKCERFFTREQDGLKQEWTGCCWMNPPYGRDIGKWMRKAYESTFGGGATVVCLVPARTDTAWWHEYAMKGKITFIRGRLKFGGCKNSAPFPSAVVVFEEAHMINRGEVLRCDLCDKVLAISDDESPLVQAVIREEHLKKTWMPNEKTHVCIACKRKYVRGGGVAKDCRQEAKP